MSSRTKSRSKPSTIVGTKVFKSKLQYLKTDGTMELSNSKVVKDSTSPHPFVDPNPLRISEVKNGFVRLNGTISKEIFGSEASREVFNGYPINKITPSFGISSLTPLSSYAALAAERASPTPSEVNFGEFLQSLYEIPRMITNIRDIMQTFSDELIPNLGKAFLTNEFGVQPLINDLSSIVSLQRSLANSARNQRKADKGRSFKGTLYKNTSKSSSRHWFNTSFYKHSYDLETTYFEKVWYSVRFQPPSGGGKVPNGLLDYARSFDLDRPVQTVWQLIPWSFLIDYFVDVSAFLSNIEGRGSYSIKDISIMRNVRASSTVIKPRQFNIPSGFYSIGLDTLKINYRPGHVEWKQRDVFRSGNFVPFKFFLNAGQITNIVALVSTRV